MSADKKKYVVPNRRQDFKHSPYGMEDSDASSHSVTTHDSSNTTSDTVSSDGNTPSDDSSIGSDVVDQKSRASSQTAVSILGATNECTFILTGKKYKHQWMQHCNTCFGTDRSLLACPQCVQHCHFGHSLDKMEWIEAFCDTGAYQPVPVITNPFVKTAYATRKATDVSAAVSGNHQEPISVRMIQTLVASTAATHVPGQSLVHSPFNIVTALSILALGATNACHQELCRALHLVNQGKGLLQDLQSEQKWLCTMTGVAQKNWIYVAPNLPLKKTFVDAITPLASVETWTPGDVKAINDQVKTFTKGLIPQLLVPSDMPQNAAFVVLSVLYFHMSLTQAFPVDKTRDRPFGMVPDDRKAAVRLLPMMELKNKTFRYFEDRQHQCLELCFAENKKEWVIGFVRPKQNTPIGDRSTGVTPDVALFRDTKMERIWIPKFRRSFRASLKPMLQSMGVTSCFTFHDSKSVSFGHMTDNDVALHDIIHMCVVDLDEVGFKAAAATVAIAKSRCISSDPEFMMDKPGFWYIRHLPTGAILFQDIFD